MEEKLEGLGIRKSILPLGSIVTIEDHKESVMVIGRKLGVKNSQGNLEVFDYGGCLYPEGLINGQGIFFNSKDIQGIIHIGYVNEKEETIRKEYEAWEDTQNA